VTALNGREGIPSIGFRFSASTILNSGHFECIPIKFTRIGENEISSGKHLAKWMARAGSRLLLN
jgi:hypothetical protein